MCLSEAAPQGAADQNPPMFFSDTPAKHDTFEGVNLEDADKLFITKVKETPG